MSAIIRMIGQAGEIPKIAAELRKSLDSAEITASDVLDGFEAWAAALGGPETANIAGVQFLRMWLRRGTLEPIISRELGTGAICGGWSKDGHASLRAYPVGIVGHWPAGNVEIQPALSMSCALLGGNACMVRVPRSIYEPTRLIIEKLEQSDYAGLLAGRVRVLVFDHARTDVQEMMARCVDGAMIWGGEEAVLYVRGLPFPHWARLSIFGPRISVAAMDANSWSNTERHAEWCRRIARDVWQFDQQACSSPQVLFLERKTGYSPSEFMQSLRKAFETENQLHPREAISAALTTVICQARAAWLFDKPANSAIFTQGPDWTILLGSGTEIPELVQGRTLTVLEVDDLVDAIGKFDGNVQTLGLAMVDPDREAMIAALAGRRGVDRIVKLGRMHVFVSPWDGLDLIRPMVRMIRYVPSTEL